MPRVKINRDVIANDGEGHDMLQPQVSVCWRNDPDGGGHVQLQIEIDTAMAQKWVADALEHNPTESTVGFWTEVMDRNEINKAVRTLRTARDKAYGADA